MYVYNLCIGLNQNATKDIFYTDCAGIGKLPFNNQTNISLDRQESIGGKSVWLAPLGSPQEVDNCLCGRMLTLEKTLESAISRALPCSPAHAQQSIVNTDFPHNFWVACFKDEMK